ncbi:MAG TPA: HEAT repeat domain-containing protein [Planctomycetota bacterium]
MTQEGIPELVEKMPPLDKGGTFTAPAWDEAIPVFDAILKGNGVSAVIDLLKPVDDGQDYKARYVLHAMAQYLGRPGKEVARAKFSTDLAAALSSDKPASVRGYLARQLQVIGGREAVPALGKALADPELCEFAAQALLAIGDGAAAEFRKAYPAVTGPARLTVLQAFGVLKDVEALDALRAAAKEPETRLLAVWGLANIGDADAIDLALKAADVEPVYERVKGTSACLLLAERLLAAGKKADAVRIYKHLESTRTEPSEAYVRELAAEALAR